METKYQIMPNGAVVPLIEPLTKREIFAAMAMQGMATASAADSWIKYAASESVKFADALIEALAASEPKGDVGCK